MKYFDSRKAGIALFSILVFAVGFLLIPRQQALAGKLGNEHAPVHKSDKHQTHEILIGERLFYGLAAYEAGKFNCEGCHHTGASDTLNWYPSALDLALWIKGKSDAEVMKTFTTPASAKMEESHKKMTVNADEVRKLRDYLGFIEEKGLAPLKPFPLRLILFFLFGALMAMALVDLIWTRYVKYRIIHVLVLIIGLGMHIQLAVTEAIALGRTPGYMPDQPIKFSHKVHAGDNKIDCQYCHTSATSDKSAGLPSAQVCLNCHTAVLNGRNSGKFEISKIKRAVAENKPIEWIRVHKLPDHVFFSHAQHVNAGKIDCQTCHGPVETMDILSQHSDLSMGWCVNCHRKTNVQFDNAYYKNMNKLHDMAKDGKTGAVTAETIGGLDCMKCHY